jgi:predicted nucleic-acid-binding protein
MLVGDTNVVVRYLTNDDPAQAACARRLLEQDDVFVPLTVLLESE